MKQFLPILVLVCSAWSQAGEPPRPAAPQASPPASAQAAGSGAAGSAPAAAAPTISADQENARKAKALIDQAIQALGGQNYLTIRDREQQGRSYSFHHGRPSNGGVIFWGFSEFPDKERVELTKERDVTELYIGNKGYEITYKGAHLMEKKDLEDYQRRRRFSLDIILRTWINDPGVVLLFEGFAIAAQHPAQQVTLINAQNESVTLYFDNDSHLPVKKTFTWRDPDDRQKNLEEEVYENYRAVSGIMAPYNVTRFFNGDMASQRFLNSVTINQALDQAMFDPNSGYDPNKPVGKQNSKH
ncbi:MAG: hypothetical protein ACLPHP_17750 [Candidatus Sulfotelmatobacter sp.]